MLNLAARRQVTFPNGDFLRTPVLVPSFSSRVSQIATILRASEQFLDGPFLVSAFDVAGRHILPPFDFAGPVFLDSGGYELTHETDLSDVGSEAPGDPDEWTEQSYRDVLHQWNPKIASLAVTYDHPRLRSCIEEQIDRASVLLARKPELGWDVLLKPETRDQQFLNIKSLTPHVSRLSQFHVIGVTEKEIGNSVHDRMLNIARLRIALNEAGLNTPIHVFGSLDTITTLFYFVAGADIFDGLTWLRYAFSAGKTIYRQDYGITAFGIGEKAPRVEALCWAHNYQYMKTMELEMRRFASTGDYSAFSYHSELLQSASEVIKKEVDA